MNCYQIKFVCEMICTSENILFMSPYCDLDLEDSKPIFQFMMMQTVPSLLVKGSAVQKISSWQNLNMLRQSQVKSIVCNRFYNI